MIYKQRFAPLLAVKGTNAGARFKHSAWRRYLACCGEGEQASNPFAVVIKQVPSPPSGMPASAPTLPQDES